MTPLWPATVHKLIRERDQARRIAVQLEQENANLAQQLAHALMTLEDAGLIEVDE